MHTLRITIRLNAINAILATNTTFLEPREEACPTVSNRVAITSDAFLLDGCLEAVLPLASGFPHELTHTVPASSWRPTSSARETSLPQTEAPRPWWVELAREIASEIVV